MDLENLWKQSSGNDDELNKLLQEDFKHLHSKHPLLRLKKRLLIDTIGGLLIMVCYITLLFFISYWQVYVCICIVIVFNGFLLFKSWKLYKHTPSSIISSNSLKEELERNYNSLQKFLSQQLKVGFYVLHVAVAGGVIMGGVLSSGKTVDAFLYNFRTLGSLAIAELLVVPIVYFAIKWALNQTYGKHLKKLKSLIDEMSH